MWAAAVFLAGVAVTPVVNRCEKDDDCRMHLDFGASCVRGTTNTCNCTKRFGYYEDVLPNGTAVQVTTPLYIYDDDSNTCAPIYEPEKVVEGRVMGRVTDPSVQYMPRIWFTVRATFESTGVAADSLNDMNLHREFEALLKEAVPNSHFEVAFTWQYPTKQMVLAGSVPRSQYPDLSELESRVEQLLRLGRESAQRKSRWPLTWAKLDPLQTRPAVQLPTNLVEVFQIGFAVHSGSFPCYHKGATLTTTVQGERDGNDYTICQPVTCAEHLEIKTTNFRPPYPERQCHAPKPGMESREIVGLVIGIVLGLVVLAVVVIFLCRSPQETEKGEVEGGADEKEVP